MKANEFIKREGLEEARFLLDEWDGVTTNWSLEDGFVYVGSSVDTHMLCLETLKRLVESHELVAIHGFEKSKEIVANAPSDDHFYSWTLGGSGVRDKTVNIGELRKAIADVESCMELANDSY